MRRWPRTGSPSARRWCSPPTGGSWSPAAPCRDAMPGSGPRGRPLLPNVAQPDLAGAMLDRHGRRLMLAGKNGPVTVRDTASGRVAGRPGPAAGAPVQAILSPDGSRVAVLDGRGLVVYDAASP